HLACTRDDVPYIVPMNYAFDGQYVYFFTTVGTKTEFMAANQQVCFQVEELFGAGHWRSVMLMGRAEHVSAPPETERAMQLISERNPALTPALNQTEIGAWTRLNRIAIYRVRPDGLYGRKTT
ncbi:MAG TPA: pyridoxamine 5'-phosphate oxidase family protein, partial [Pyrinomonadaceae bacterium]|nr:pyridoxamine 5'-phosphate oxidase family protein [Pyrinomonadaceae bacterium]